MKRWIKYGLIQGTLMAVIITVLFPLIDGTFSTIKLLTGIPVFMLSGLLWGYFMLGRHPKKLQDEKVG
ncbi:hypothetical protein R1T16_15445 [Flavobacterium sp. DG1-102-2]|uniref:hypothetical protein n=1 Tax=Flavobacterium sp. DG1-102-2 TaxID=3081663 RepID=UPI002949C0DA|nr:hypothetical protein [Flavobacterium sp. DG1-102-2]MDV6169831.1 hypothetical protein [Flavobacterium sp. DG1-102-2]